MDGSGRIPDGFGRIPDGYGRIWTDSLGSQLTFFKLISISTEADGDRRIWPDIDGFGRIWTDSGRIWTDSDDVQPGGDL